MFYHDRDPGFANAMPVNSNGVPFDCSHVYATGAQSEQMSDGAISRAVDKARDAVS